MNYLVILDLDGVVIRGQSQQIFLNYLLKKRMVSLFFYIRIFLWFIIYKLGLASNPDKIMNFAFSSLKSRTQTEVKDVVDKFFEERLKKFIFPEIVDIIKENRKNGAILLIVSNAIELIVKKVADYLIVENYIGTELEIINGKLTGKMRGDPVYGKNKIDRVNKFIKDKNLDLIGSCAYADHISDLDLLLKVSNPIVTNPDVRLSVEAKRRNWPILKFRK